MQKTWVRICTTLLTLGIMIMIFCFSTEPAEKSDTTSGVIAQRVADVVQPGWKSLEARARKIFYDTIHTIVRKLAHFTEFAMLGFSLRLCLESWLEGKGRRLGRIAWGGATLYAALDEGHQLLVDGRSGQWTDVLIDSGGVLIGVLVAMGILSLIRRIRTA